MLPDHVRWANKIEIPHSNIDCWEWTGAKYRGGYGHFRRKIGGKWVMYKAHRYAFEFYRGTIPDGMPVCHACDNPYHLFLGTIKDNNSNRDTKGRTKFGTKKGNRQLSLELAEAIREYKKENEGLTLATIGKIFKTSAPQVCRVINNKIWVSPERGR